MPCASAEYNGGQQVNHKWQNYSRSVDMPVGNYWTPAGPGDGLPLEPDWSASRGDNFIPCTGTGANDASAAGYQSVQTG